MRCLEFVRTDAAEMTMTARYVVKTIGVLGYVRDRYFLAGVDTFLIRSFFKLLKKDSATALSQQLARLPMLGSK